MRARITQLLAAAFLVAAPAAADDASGLSRKIGVLLPLTGDFAYFGEEAKQGVELALDDLRAKGEPVPQIVYEDEKCLAVEAITGMKRLIEREKVAGIIGPVCSTSIQATAPVAGRSGVPVLYLLDAGEAVATFNDPLYSLGFDPPKMARSLAEDLLKRGVRKAAVISEEEEYALMLATSFEEQWKTLGGVLTAHENQLLSEKNFRPLIMKVLSKSPDAIFFSSAYDAGNFLKQLRTVNKTVYAYGNDTMCVSATTTTAGAAGNGARCANVVLDEKFELIKTFRSRLGAKFGKAADSLFYTALGYDAVMLIPDFLGKAGAETRAVIFKGVTRNSEGMYSIEPSILEIKNGLLEPVSK